MQRLGIAGIQFDRTCELLIRAPRHSPSRTTSERGMALGEVRIDLHRPSRVLLGALQIYSLIEQRLREPSVRRRGIRIDLENLLVQRNRLCPNPLA